MAEGQQEIRVRYTRNIKEINIAIAEIDASLKRFGHVKQRYDFHGGYIVKSSVFPKRKDTVTIIVNDGSKLQAVRGICGANWFEVVEDVATQ